MGLRPLGDEYDELAWSEFVLDDYHSKSRRIVYVNVNDLWNAIKALVNIVVDRFFKKIELLIQDIK